MQTYTRRTLLKRGAERSAELAAVSSFAALPSSLLEMRSSGACSLPTNSTPPITDPSVKVLSDAVLSAAWAAGAAYSDVRLTHTYTRGFDNMIWDSESMHFGVRTLVDGYWGFAASPIWTPQEAVRLARAAVENAKANTLGKSRVVDLAPVAAVANGQWTMPIIDDPFLTSEDEIQDFLDGTVLFIKQLQGTSQISAIAGFVKQDKAFASTDNHFLMQRSYRSAAVIRFLVGPINDRYKGVVVDTTTPAGLGFEYLRDQPLREEIVRRYEEAMQALKLPLKAVEVGRYALVLDARSVAELVNATIGSATELDRAMGYEANAGGTSYITDPSAMVGTFNIGAPLLTVTANRTEPGGVATVKWDDEGVEAQEFSIVKEGMLVDMQTNREGAGWLKDAYTKQQRPFASRGCAYAPGGGDVPLTHCANLRMQAATHNTTLETLVTEMSKGIVIKHAEVDMDFQQVTGLGSGEAFEIKDGKPVAELQGAGFLFRTPELWNSLTALGGLASSRRFGLKIEKGEPEQVGLHSVTAPPVAIKELSVIDITRKA